MTAATLFGTASGPVMPAAGAGGFDPGGGLATPAGVIRPRPIGWCEHCRRYTHNLSTHECGKRQA